MLRQDPPQVGPGHFPFQFGLLCALGGALAVVLYIPAAFAPTSLHVAVAPSLSETLQPSLRPPRSHTRLTAGTAAAAQPPASALPYGLPPPVRPSSRSPVRHAADGSGLGALAQRLFCVGAVVASLMTYGLGRARAQRDPAEPDAEAGLGLQPLFPPAPRGAAPLAVCAAPPPRLGLALQATASPDAVGAPGLALCSAVANIPHPEKVSKGGEDAWFLQVDLDGTGSAVGVADGVGGYAAEGIDAGVYAKVLMREAQQASAAQPPGAPDPTAVLVAAQRATRLPGAAPAVVVQMTPDGRALAANVGDCGFRVVRDGAVVAASEVGQHHFDCPYQLTDPNCGFDGVDLAEERAVVSDLQLRAGDVLLLASDGLYDNVHEAELLEIVAATLAQGAGGPADRTTQGLADALAARASEHALDPAYASPYGAEWTAHQRELMGITEADDSMFGKLWGAAAGDEPLWEGGKLDDITVVAAVVVPAAANAAALASASAAAAGAKAHADALLAPHLAHAEKQQRLLAEKAAAQGSAAAARAAQKAAADETKPLKYSEAEVEAMDKEALRKALAAAGLPTSGKLSKLQERVAAIRE